MEIEIYEETGMYTCAQHLAVVCEKFFNGVSGAIDGFDCHTI